MILKSVKLENIRSYVNEEIKFPEGSLLLAGDIGSGKSTILLAMEFALFGIKSDLPGEVLLRHGKNSGGVELRFSLENKDIIVKRTLKRMKDAVRQDSGYIIIDDKKTEGIATELKTRIISLLGYPKSLIAKSKDLIYRFTVYTPQEEMKQILYESKDIRLDTLRKVFGIDKYKRIKENIQSYVRELKSKKKEYEASVADLDEKQRQKKEKEDNIETIKTNMKKLEPELRQINEDLVKQKEVLDKYEKDIQELNNLNSKLELYDNNILYISEQNKRLNEETEELGEETEKIKKEIDEKELLKYEELIKDIKTKEKEVEDKENNLGNIKNMLSELLVLKNKSEELKEKITKLDTCPVCKQKVTKEHIEHIKLEEDTKLKDFNEKIELYEKQENEISELIKKLKNNINELKEKEKKLEVNKVKLSNLKEKIERISKLKQNKEEFKKKIGELNTKRLQIKEKIEKFKDLDKKYKKEKELLNNILDEQKELEIKISELKKEKEMLDKIIKDLEEEIKKKIKIKGQINYIMQVQNWLEEYFINLMSAMEKQVLSKVYNEFNELVKEWFNMLIEDEVLNIRLDEEFTPVIEQNGYETSLQNLSGGEKTAVALAYRLALNKVINDLITGIKTKNLIILDEPTDGFSTEQLDRVKEVIDSLNIKQIVIVSHEPKIETFVDNVIRIGKAEHVSHIA